VEEEEGTVAQVQGLEQVDAGDHVHQPRIGAIKGGDAAYEAGLVTTGRLSQRTHQLHEVKG